MFTGTTAYACPNVIFDLWANQLGSVLGTKNDVQINLRKCIGHVLIMREEGKSPVPGANGVGACIRGWRHTHGYSKPSLRDAVPLQRRTKIQIAPVLICGDDPWVR